ncbi:MAG: tetraacyldisaccharide 4'-kinase [Nitrospiraceae bacterium]|nr:MAG: tetraacyldisaccharide 4'-kinase [Nitrospiraceae bacterium]
MGLLSSLYSLGLTCRTFYYRHLKTPGRLPVKVISIGNITLGGTGKTPAVIKVAEEARKRGFHPCILTRGYKGNIKETCFVSNGKEVMLNPDEAGDEPYLIAARLNGIPVVKGSKRYEAGLFALNRLAIRPSLIILDDGFQHIAIERDINVLLIDGTNPFGNRKLFPEGIMREPLTAMRRADYAIITKSDMIDKNALADIKAIIKNTSPGMPVYESAHKPAGLIHISGYTEEPEHISNKDVFVFAGIANSGYFASTVKMCGARIKGFKWYRDHHAYSAKDMSWIRQKAEGLYIITTEKDLVKLKKLKVPENLYALAIDFAVDNIFLDSIFRRLS